MVTFIFLRRLCGYVWVNILTLSLQKGESKDGIVKYNHNIARKCCMQTACCFMMLGLGKNIRRHEHHPLILYMASSKSDSKSKGSEPKGSDKVSMLIYTYPHKPLRKI